MKPEKVTHDRTATLSVSAFLRDVALPAAAGGLLHLMACVLLLGMGLLECCQADIVLFHTPHPHRAEEEAIRRVAEFYGLNIHTVDVTSREALGPAMSELKSPGTVGVMISEDVLSQLDGKHVRAALHRSNGSHVPILVFGVHAGDRNNELKSWSGGAIRDCSPLEPDYRPKALEVENLRTLTRTLAGLQLPAVAVPECRMQFEPAPMIQTVLSISAEDGVRDTVVLVRTRTAVGEVFFVPQMRTFDTSWIGKPDALSKAFSSVAQYVLFLSYAAGSHAWHTDGQYANLTIDDPWLTQPYGHLDYRAVLAEMEKHNFHTTIAFIPWNFDRSEHDLVAVFREHPERFSICIHGNNHAHREFGDYASNSFAQQTADIKQAIARMERFGNYTGIPYDRFMVFPHGVAPAPTFAALKTYGFLGTANFSNVPLGTKFPTDSLFLLRPYTIAYGGLLSLSRYSASGNIPRLEIAIHTFLGNPLLFYGHQSLFESGSGTFNAYADLVNRKQPETQWTSLGQIARHSHLLRRRDDGGFDVLMLSSEMDLANPTEEDRKFYIQWKANFVPDISSLTVDGSPAGLERSAEGSVLRLLIPARQVRRLRLRYRNDLDLSHEDIRKRSVHAYALRLISDFRDLYLSRSSWGNALARAYYGHRWDSVELYLEKRWWVAIICVAFALVGIRRLRRRTLPTRRGHGRHRTVPATPNTVTSAVSSQSHGRP